MLELPPPTLPHFRLTVLGHELVIRPLTAGEVFRSRARPALGTWTIVEGAAPSYPRTVEGDAQRAAWWAALEAEVDRCEAFINPRIEVPGIEEWAEMLAAVNMAGKAGTT